MWSKALCVVVLALSGASVPGQDRSPPVIGEVRFQGDPVLSVVELSPAGSGSRAVELAGPGLADPASGSNPREADQTLTTTVQDSDNPDEPWVVVTYKKPGEALAAFIKRHRDMVTAVRQALDG